MKSKLLALSFIPLLILPSCSMKDYVKVEERDIQYIDDNYRNYYQIFPISFADSNGDGKGDLQGIIDKFDYLKDLNMTGLWLTPVNPSPSYHKYDVTDYKAIDSQFGTLDTYDALVKKCHDNNMSIILDLVFNHSSYDHPWFYECMQAHINNDTSNKYYNYYVVQPYTGEPAKGWARYQNSNYIYECRFWDRMPDFNLQGVIDGTNTYLINDFKDIIKFWLVDHNIDGFRLDACTSFFTDNLNKNIEFLNWLKAECNKVKDKSYVIGEVLEGSGTYSLYYNSNIESFFCFDDTANRGNRIYNSIVYESVSNVDSFINRDIKAAKGHVPAPLLANHDIGRAGKSDIKETKLLHGLLSIANGATFEYYGDEIGMMSANIVDQDHRQPLLWGDSYTCAVPADSTPVDDAKKYPLGSVEAQSKDDASLLNYIRKAYKYRLENPELARGSSEVYYQSDDESVGILKREYNNSVTYIALNLSHEKTQELDISNLNVKVVGDLSINESPYFSGNKLVMPPFSMLILH